jgi:hypothetical protein
MWLWYDPGTAGDGRIVEKRNLASWLRTSLLLLGPSSILAIAVLVCLSLVTRPSPRTQGSTRKGLIGAAPLALLLCLVLITFLQPVHRGYDIALAAIVCLAGAFGFAVHSLRFPERRYRLNGVFFTTFTGVMIVDLAFSMSAVLFWSRGDVLRTGVTAVFLGLWRLALRLFRPRMATSAGLWPTKPEAVTAASLWVAFVAAVIGIAGLRAKAESPVAEMVVKYKGWYQRESPGAEFLVLPTDRFGRICKIDLMYTPVRDSDLVVLSSLGSLRELILSGTHVSDAGLRHLSHSRSLRVLHLYSTRVTAEGIRELTEALPDLHVQR